MNPTGLPQARQPQWIDSYEPQSFVGLKRGTATDQPNTRCNWIRSALQVLS